MKIFGLTFVWTVVVSLFALTGALKSPICGQPHSKDGIGLISCAALIPSWSYDAADNECVSFIYGGCGANDNRFATKAACEEMCKE